MSSFTALMALSASKTQEQNNMAQRALLERQRKEQELRKQQAEREAREREMEKKLRLKHFEDEKREQERRKRMEETQKAREAALQRKKDEQRDALLYGPKKAASGKASSLGGSSRGGSAGPRERRRLPDDDDDDSPSGSMLTREELRERKQQAEYRRLYNSSKKSSGAHAYSKSGRRLPGGAVDIPTAQQNPDALAGKSVRDRIAAMPNTLTKLNMVKRDTRTIDEIHTELQKKKEGKVLGGDEAKNFDDWFSTKKKESAKKAQPGSTAGSGADTPPSSVTGSYSPKKASAPSSLASSAVKSSTVKAAIPKSASQPISSRPAHGSRASSLDKHGPSKVQASSQPTKGPKSFAADRERERDRERDRYAPRPAMKKRPRSESRSESPPPKRRAASVEEDLPGDISSTIWSIFGRKRDNYVGMDVFSDDEDMEADARVLEREEKFSARLAKKEDLEAFEEERRHEEEKRRRKKEKERGQR